MQGQLIVALFRAGIKLNADKTFLFRIKVEYLSHLISQEGIRLIPKYVSKIV